MREKRMSRSISTVLRSNLLLLVLMFCMKATAQEETPQPTPYEPVSVEEPEISFFQGFTLSADLLGVGQWLLADYGTLEASLRLNLKNTYFPVAELGMAHCDVYEPNTDITYKTNAPYLRVGFDLNLLKDKFQDNRLFAGLRYGFSTYNFDIAGPAVVDPVWGGAESFNKKGISATSHWLELALGVQVKVWKNLHMGWSIRYKRELSTSKNNYAKPYYIPGYGTMTNSSCWGGAYYLIFDLNWGKKKRGSIKLQAPQDVKPADSETVDTEDTESLETQRGENNQVPLRNQENPVKETPSHSTSDN